MASEASVTEPGFSERFNRELAATSARLGRPCDWDVLLLCFLRLVARFGYFTLGPITIDVRLIERRVEDDTAAGAHPGEDSLVPFSLLVTREMRKTGSRRPDELHYLFALMRCNEGLPAQVFGELAVTPEDVEAYLKQGADASLPNPERLMSPEEVAAYLNVHVQTVRAWIRAGTLPARRIAGLRALRVRFADAEKMLKPLDGGE
jgi:excisionase family DNA binding protein